MHGQHCMVNKVLCMRSARKLDSCFLSESVTVGAYVIMSCKHKIAYSTADHHIYHPTAYTHILQYGLLLLIIVASWSLPH